jgi:Bacterial type II secretion system protein F domain.
MDDLLFFAIRYKLFTLLLIITAIYPAIIIVERLKLITGSQLFEAMADRNKNLSIYYRCSGFVKKTIKDYERREKKAGLYERARIKMKKAGYTSEYAAAVYILLKYIISIFVFILAVSFNYPNISRPLELLALIIVIIEMVIGGRKRKLNLKFQKYIYKIYKYLHNQISSGVKVTDAVKTVYEVIDDKQLRNVLIRLAANYELTLDIESALEDFRSNFVIHEAETLCVALRQGIETGDNQELLARQEDVMFKKYFNYIQAETDSCKTRSLMAVVMFTVIVVLMIIVPLFNDMSEAVGKIFIN